MFKATILSANRILYNADAWSVFFPGATGEFEVLELHKTIISLLKRGRIIIDWKHHIPISRGVMRMREDELVAIVEE